MTRTPVADTASGAHAALRSNDQCWCGSGRKYKRCHRSQEGKVRPGHVSAMRAVPEGIEPTSYYSTGRVQREDEAMVKPADVVQRMRRACRVAAEVLAVTGAAVAPGVTTDELDIVAHDAYVTRGAFPSTLNYHEYPKSICTSVNEVICHGIPDDRPLLAGDIVNIDVTAYIEGVHGDCSGMFTVGDVDQASQDLIDVTRRCRELGIAAVRPGRPISDIGRAIEDHATAGGYGVVRSFVGHGIGEHFHAAPSVPHYYTPEASTVMEPGMVFTIEPMITMGSWREKMWDNGWTAVTTDGLRTAQFEHTLLVTDDGAEVLTIEPTTA
ncbi:MAG: type I methionyl aminopeptidase [Actinomycetota bacterium]|nr:type I methionyl aminopeptidase [Actinomycetota bacterium]